MKTLTNIILTGALTLGLTGCDQKSFEKPFEVSCRPNKERLSFTNQDYIKHIGLTSDQIKEEDYINCGVEVTYNKNGKKVYESRSSLIVRPTSKWDGTLIAHTLPGDFVLGKKPLFFDEIVLNFKSVNKSNAKLPNPIKITVTPKLIEQYRKDFMEWERQYYSNAANLSKKTGISSGRY